MCIRDSGRTVNSAAFAGVAIGGQSRTRTSEGIAIGYKADAIGARSIAIGEEAGFNDTTTGHGGHSVAMGYKSVARGYAIALGNNTRALTSGVAIGMGTNNYLMSGQFNGEAGGSDGFLNFYTPATILNNAAANVPFTVKGAAAQSADLTQWKNSAGTTIASVKEDSGFAVMMVSGSIYANTADVSRTQSMSIGSGAAALGDYSVVIGPLSQGHTGGSATAVGRQALAGTNSVAIGNGANASAAGATALGKGTTCLLYTSPSPRDGLLSRMPSSA